ncbi:MAG TPA: glycosyltransferase [Baekduia sp.]
MTRPEQVPVAVVLAVADRDAVARCLVALLPALPADVPLLAAGSAEGLRAVAELAAGREVIAVGEDVVAGWDAASARFPDAALVLIDGATEVGPAFLGDLRAVLAAEPDAATITPLSNSGAFLSGPRRNLAWPLLPAALTVADAAARVREASLQLHPRTPSALAHLAVVTAPARALVGPFAGAGSASPGDALAAWCARATAAGLAHVVADEVYVAHRGPGEAPAVEPPAAVDEAADDRHSGLARALLQASVVLEPLRVTIDARPLGGGSVTGTTIHLVELIGALAAREDVAVRALLPARVGDEAGRALATLGGAIETADAATPFAQLGRTHVVHRPWQVESAEEMAALDQLGERTVVTNQDLIGYRTPSVFESAARWRDYRVATRDALGLAAMVVFFSQTAADDALADDLVAPERVRVVPLGAQNEVLKLSAAAVPPAGFAVGEGRPFLLVLGSRFRHKNVRFALELLGSLREDHGWDGDLVIAGAEVLHGSGSGDDAAWLLAHPAHAPHVHAIGTVSEAEKAWMLAAAAAVVYPSTYEGFGLIPFEAAQAGTPCLVASVSALRDTLPPEPALLVPWDARASAARALPVLAPGAARTEHVAALRAAGAPLTWSATGAGLMAAYRAAIGLPAPATTRLASDLARAEHDYWSARDGIQDGAWRLVRPDAPLLDEALAHRLGAILDAPGGRERLLDALPDRPSAAARAAARLRDAAGARRHRRT